MATFKDPKSDISISVPEYVLSDDFGYLDPNRAILLSGFPSFSSPTVSEIENAIESSVSGYLTCDAILLDGRRVTLRLHEPAYDYQLPKIDIYYNDEIIDTDTLGDGQGPFAYLKMSHYAEFFIGSFYVASDSALVTFPSRFTSTSASKRYVEFLESASGPDTYVNFRALASKESPVPIIGGIPVNQLWVTPFPIGTTLYIKYEVVLPENVDDNLDEPDIGHWTEYTGAVDITPYDPKLPENEFHVAVPGEDYEVLSDGRSIRILGNGKASSILLEIRPVGIEFDPGDYVNVGPGYVLFDAKISGRGGGIGPYEPGPYDPGGPSGPGGGGGSFGNDEVSDIIDYPDGSVEANSSSAGLFTKYLVNPSQMLAFADYLWADNLFEALIKEAVELLYGTAAEAIISVLSLPFNPQSLGVSGRSGRIYIGSADSGVSAGILGSTFAQFNWGSIPIGEYFGSFLDYAPHTKIELYLPYNVGFVNIDPNDVVDGTISVVTNFEFDKGTCIHIVSGKNGVIGTYDGVFGKQLPITSFDTSGKALSAVVGAVGAIMSGASSAMGSQAAANAAIDYGAKHTMYMGNQANIPQIPGYQSITQYKAGIAQAEAKAAAPYNKISAGASKVFAASSLAAFRIPAHVQRSGSFTGNTGGMNVQYPFIRVSRPTQSVVENYGHYVGYPSNMYATLASLKGYTEIASIHLDGFSATQNERDEIDNLLKGGVII